MCAQCVHRPRFEREIDQVFASRVTETTFNAIISLDVTFINCLLSFSLRPLPSLISIHLFKSNRWSVIAFDIFKLKTIEIEYMYC